MGKGRVRGRQGRAAKAAKAAKLAGRVKVSVGCAFAGELGTVQSNDGEIAIVKLDCKDVAQAIPVASLVAA